MTPSVEQKRGTPWWFWTYAIVLLGVYLLGVAQLPLQFFGSEAERSAQLPAEALAIMRAEPWWATAGYATGLIAGLLGTVCLLHPRTRRLVRVFFVVSILGFLTQRAWFFALSGLTHLLPAVAHVTLFVVVLINVIGIWLARSIRHQS